MENYEPFVSLGIALAAGLLLGIEREQSRPQEEEEGRALGGARTHPLFALIGALSMLLSRQVGVLIVIASCLGIFSFLAISYADDIKKDRDRGLTAEGALFVSYLLGVLSTSEGVIEPLRQRLLAIASLAVIVTWLLSVKPRLHGFIQKISKEDIGATLKFLLVAVVAFPLLPDQTFGPLDVLNPSQIGLMVALIAGISFVGYLAIRLLGPQRGIGLTGLIGGLVSSTAVTLSFSDRAKKHPALAAPCALAVILASSIMFGRVLLEVAVVNPSLLRVLAVPTGAMGFAGFLSSLLFYQRAKETSREEGAVRFKNPFELSSAFKFALLFALVLLGAKAATTYSGTSAIYLAGLLAGLTDVDAITLSMAELARDQISAEVAATTIFFGMTSNTLVKAGMALVVGGRAFGRAIALAFGAILAAGAAGLALVWLF